MKTFAFALTVLLLIPFAACRNEASHTQGSEKSRIHTQESAPESKPVANPVPEKPTTPEAAPESPKAETPEKKGRAPQPMKALPEKTTLQMQKPVAEKPTPRKEAPSAPAPQTQPPVLKVPVKRNVPSHAEWDFLLRRFVNTQGRVNYAALKKEERKLDNYLNILRENPPAPDWSKAEELAYWINTYNAFTIKLILEHWPVSSITKLHGGKPWDVKWIQLGDKKYSLNQIENEIIRPKFKEPRIHFAVNCAARSCPPLLNQAWTPRNLEPMFERQARLFINDPAYNKIQPHVAQLSKIFDWYSEDFGDLVAFINRYSKVKLRPDAQITFLEYDWALNKQ